MNHRETLHFVQGVDINLLAVHEEFAENERLCFRFNHRNFVNIKMKAVNLRHRA